MIATFLYSVLWVLIITAGFLLIAYVWGRFTLCEHRGVSREEFVRTFEERGIANEIPAFVYDFYKTKFKVKEFSVAPDDEFHLLGEGEDELLDDAEEMLEKLGLQPPSNNLQLKWIELVIARRRSEGIPGFGVNNSPILTVRDLVLWLDWLRTPQRSAGG